MTLDNPKYIVVEGAIGIGKTTLARRLAQTFGSDLLLEDAAANPFLERFYQNPRQTALSTQLFFLLQRVRQMRDLQQALSQPDMFQPAGRVADFLIDKDPLFARLTLDDDELRLYEQVRQQLVLDAPPPDLVIYLQAPVEVLLTRIGRRGRGHEKLIESSYLQRLADAYARFFHHYSAAPLLIVNAAEVNYVENDRDYDLLVEQVRAIRSGRHYFNPLPFA